MQIVAAGSGPNQVVRYHRAMPRWIIAAAIAVGLATAPSSARADERWYGWKTLAADGGAYVMVVGGGVGDNDTAMAAGAAIYLLLPPTIHAYHEEYARAGLSLGLRAGLPFAGLWIGAKLCNPRRHEGEFLACLGEAIVGGLVGVVTAQAIDAAVLAYTDDGTSTQPRMFTLGTRF